MSQLIEAMRGTGLPFEAAESGRWVRFEGKTCTVYVVEAGRDGSYVTWCERWDDRRVERYLTAAEAIAAGLRRAAQPLRPPLSAAPFVPNDHPAAEDVVASMG